MAALAKSLIVALAAALTPACARPPETVRVMTYNIWGGRGDLAGVAEAIRASGADIVGLQEVAVHWGERTEHPDQATYLAEATGMHVYFGPIYTIPSDSAGSPPRQFGLAVLSREPFTSTHNHEITRHSTQTPDAPPSPMPGFIEVVVPVGGAGVRVFDTHLDFRRDPAVRRRQVADMLAVIGDAGGPTILLGDMNARPDAEELNPLFERFRDAWPADAGPGYTGPNPEPDRRIDYVLISPEFEVDGARVVTSTASDHRPVVVDLVLRSPPR